MTECLPLMIRLIHPIYLDVPMLVSFAAALDGGLSFRTELERGRQGAREKSAKIGVDAGTGSLLSQLFRATAASQGSVSNTENDSEIRRESKSHTEASIAIVLYDRLIKEEYISHVDKPRDFAALEPGALIELSGKVEKNAVDTVIDTIDAITTMTRMSADPGSGGSKGNRSKNNRNVGATNSLASIREALDQDRRRTPISNVLLRCTAPEGMTAVATLRTANLRDLTLSELSKNNVNVVGKVTRVVNENENMSAFENYGFALLRPEMLEQTFRSMGTDDVRFDFSEVVVRGPAVQVLPLMVFV